MNKSILRKTITYTLIFILIAEVIIFLNASFNAKSTENNDITLEQRAIEDLKAAFVDSTSLEETIPIRSKIWDKLLDLEYEVKGVDGYTPKFTDKQLSLDKQVVILEGYMYPLDEYQEQRYFMLSYNPVSTCFFCGGAGPESIVEVNSPEGILLQSKRIKLKGKIELNANDPHRLFYILNEAVLVEEE